MRVTDELLTTFAKFDDNGTECAISFDIPNPLFEELLSTQDEQLSNMMRRMLSQNPFRISIREPIIVNIAAVLGQPTKGIETTEDFVPFIVESFTNLPSSK